MDSATRTGALIRDARERKKWTQRQLADALGVDRKTVNNWENGRAFPRNRIGALEAVLDIRLRDDDEGGAPQPPGPRPLTEQERAAVLEEIGRLAQQLSSGGGQQERGGPPPNEHRNRTRIA